MFGGNINIFFQSIEEFLKKLYMISIDISTKMKIFLQKIIGMSCRIIFGFTILKKG